jgi:hypothetical protein
MDPDLNKYDLHHRVSHHPNMSDAEWEEAYKAAWATYFTWEHMETVARRHARLQNGRPKKALQYLNEFRMLYENEGVHTLEGGVVRRKRRRSRRPTLRREPAFIFYPKFVVGSARKAFNYWRGFRQQKSLLQRIINDPERYNYSDLSLQKATEEELDSLDMFQKTRGGVEAVARKQRSDEFKAAKPLETIPA